MFVLEADCRSLHESESWIERGVTDHDDQAMTLGPTRVENRAHELRTNALPMALGQHRHSHDGEDGKSVADECTRAGLLCWALPAVRLFSQGFREGEQAEARGPLGSARRVGVTATSSA